MYVWFIVLIDRMDGYRKWRSGEDQKFLLQAFNKKLISMVLACLYIL